MRIVFDMDGTIAALYQVDKWLEKLRNNDASPYAEAKPMWDMKKLSITLRKLQKHGISISIVSWLSKESNKTFDHDTRAAKKAWLQEFDFPADEIHIVKYGTPKGNYRVRNDRNILIDDNADVRKQFEKFNNCSAINPTEVDIIAWLERLVEE